jgi:transposase InsO family protein
MERINPKEIIKTYKELKNISETARYLGISRNTVKKWLVRSRSPYTLNYSTRNLKRQSTKPHKIHRKLDPVDEIRLVELRKEYGLDQVKLSKLFQKQYGICVSPKTVYNILRRRNPELIQSKPKHRRPKFQNGSHMRPSNTKEVGYIQADTKHVTPELSGLSYTTYEFAFIDIFSRYKVAWIMPSVDQEASIVALRHMLKQMPCKVKFIQTDNGWEYSKRYNEECKKHNIEHYYIHKSSPNENAVIERSFRTDQDEFYYRLEKRPTDINELNILYQKYLIFYNEVRPHFGIDLETPLSVINSATL